MIQLQVLNYLLETKDSSMLQINNLNKDFFEDYVDEYLFIDNHLKQYGTIPDKASFLDKFNNFDVIQVSENTNYLIDKLYEDRNARKLAGIFNNVREKLMSGEVEEAMNLYTTSADSIVTAKHLQSVDITQDTSRYDTYVDRADDFYKFYVKTGFPELDEIIGGWDKNEEYGTIVARSNQGKSWILMKCAASALEQGLRVGIYSGEMSETKVGYRIDTLLSHLPNSAMVRGDRSIQNEYKKYLENLKSRYTGFIKVLTPTMIGGPAGVTALRAFIEKEKLDILFIDQHSLLEDDRHAKNPVEKASNISKDIKNLQVLLKIPIITVSQQNRATTEYGVQLSHIAQSDRIGQDSTIVLFFEQEDGIMSMHLVKSRDSVNNKKLSYSVDLNVGKFTYIPEEGNALDGKGADTLREEYEEVDGEEVF